MNYSKILLVEVIDDRTLLIKFDNNQKKKYNISQLLKEEMFFSLKNHSLFKTV